MKIVHICTNNPYIDGWGYQENLLPLYLSKEGIESVVIASNKLPKDFLNGKIYPLGEYYLDGVKVIRIRCTKIKTSLTFTHGLYKTLQKEKPDVIFHHNPNFTSLVLCSIYCQRNNIKMLVDNHADLINCNKNKLYQLIYYRFMVGGITNLFQKPIYKYYGVTHSRCDFLANNFGVSKNKIEFLPIGVDVDTVSTLNCKEKIREKYKFQPDDIIITSGGKMGKGKGTPELIKCIHALHKKNNKIKLLLFGKFEDKETESMIQNMDFITVEGWCDRIKTLELIKMSDLACWPIHHTTLCEDAVACKTPLLLRETKTTEHLIEGNGFFMKNGNYDELYYYISQFINLKEEEKKQIEYHSQIMYDKLSYHTIAKQVIKDSK